jgi:hypothetical protein
MKHKVFLIIICLLGILLAFMFLNNKTAEAPVIPIDSLSDTDLDSEITIEDKIKNIEITVPDTQIKVRLENGSAKFEKDGTEGFVTILSILGTLNNSQDIFVETIVNFGGSGSFKYLLSFENKDNNITYKSFIYIGDRLPLISLKQIGTDENGYFAELTYLDRGINDSFVVEPNIKSRKIFRIENSTILPTRSKLDCSGSECVTSLEDTLIYVSNIVSGQKINNPLRITGQARGYWFFEASFPIVLTDWNGLIIAEGFATANSEWMTENFVPFTAELNFVKPVDFNNGNLILQKDNPSGEYQFDDALEISVTF